MSSRRDAPEVFARLLEDPHARSADELAGATELVALLRSTGSALEPQTTLSAVTRAAQRQRLLAVAHVQGIGTAAAAAAEPAAAAEATGRLAGLRRVSASLQATRRTVVVAGGMASVVAVAGVAVASSRSLPGDPFYDVKRSTEAVQLKLSTSEAARGELHLAIAGTRLREVEGLSKGRDGFALGPAATTSNGLGALGGSTSVRIMRTLEAMDDQTSEGVQVLSELSRDKQDPAPLERVAAFATAQAEKLGALLPSLPTGARDQATVSLALVKEVRAESQQLLDAGFCTTACDPAQALPTAPAAVPGSTPGTTLSAPGAPPCACPPARPAPTDEPGPTTTPGPVKTRPPLAPRVSAPVVPSVPGAPSGPPGTTPPLPTAPTVPPGPTIPVRPLLPLPLPTSIPLPSLPLPLPLPTAIELPPLPLPSLPGLPPLFGEP